MPYNENGSIHRRVMEMKRFGLLWKCLLLAALDVGTVLLFFSVWDVVRLNIFPSCCSICCWCC